MNQALGEDGRTQTGLPAPRAPRILVNICALPCHAATRPARGLADLRSRAAVRAEEGLRGGCPTHEP
jgi:hypothetical protein